MTMFSKNATELRNALKTVARWVNAVNPERAKYLVEVLSRHDDNIEGLRSTLQMAKRWLKNDADKVEYIEDALVDSKKR